MTQTRHRYSVLHAIALLVSLVWATAALAGEKDKDHKAHHPDAPKVEASKDKPSACMSAMGQMMGMMGEGGGMAQAGEKGKAGGMGMMGQGHGMMGEGGGMMEKMMQHMSMMDSPAHQQRCLSMMKNLSPCGKGDDKACGQLHGGMADLMKDRMAQMQRQMRLMHPKSPAYRDMQAQMRFMQEKMNALQKSPKKAKP